MIGMSQIRKRLMYGIAIGAGIGVIAVVAVLIWAFSVVNSYKEGTNKDYIANYTTEVIMLSKDVMQGETITDDMITRASVHNSSVPVDLVAAEPTGMVAKYNIPANIPLVNSMFGTEIVTVDERIQEVSSIVLPTDLVEGEYIDVKIKMASGIEYVVVPQIKVREIIGNTVKLYLSEEDLYYLNSAIVDTYLSEGGSILYGVKYVDPTTQINIGDVILDEEGNEVSISDLAKIKLSKKIEDDVAKGVVALTIPDKVSKKTVVEETEENGEVKVEVTTEDEKDTKEYINFTDNLSDLILKYAIEYRYYVESYNKVERTYQPSNLVMEHMRKNRYITDEAKEKLNADARRELEEKLLQFKNENSEDAYESVIAGLEEQVTIQQDLRKEILSGE